MSRKSISLALSVVYSLIGRSIAIVDLKSYHPFLLMGSTSNLAATFKALSAKLAPASIVNGLCTASDSITFSKSIVNPLLYVSANCVMQG